VAVLELYTSEGCSSCPPAERFVRALRANGIGNDRFLPLAFHVDYWDYLGWRDRFSDASYSRRQREIARRNRLNTVYTPQLVLDGTTTRNFTGLKEDIARLNRARPHASIMLTARFAPRSGQLTVNGTTTLSTNADASGVIFYLVVYENGLTTSVSAGENSGRSLEHDFVVRQMLEPTGKITGRTMAIERPIQMESDWDRPNLGVAALVQSTDSGDYLQAVDLPLAPLFSP
jgi:hypothetical protein